jgi:hypothetical protein
MHVHYATIDPTKSKIRTHDRALCTIDEPEKTKIRTQDHTPLLTTSADTSTINDVTAHNPKHLCIGMMRKYAMVIYDVTTHVNPKHLFDETMCYSARIGVKTQ